MLRKTRERTQSETGFTVIEVVVIVLVIAIMVAIAVPAFLGRTAKSADASARSDARNLAAQVDNCFTDTQDYNKCKSPQNTGLSLGRRRGQVQVTKTTKDGYTVVAHSESGNNFTLTKAPNGEVTRSCETRGRGGCVSAGTW